MAIHVHVHTADDAATKAKINNLLNEARGLQQKILGPMEPKAYHNKFLIEAKEAMHGVISALQEAKDSA